MKTSRPVDDVFFKKFWSERLRLIENHLRKTFRAKNFAPPILKTAMNYSVMSGGKRLRPVLVLATAEMSGLSPEAIPVLDCACAVELIHTYSLIHDDLPALDNNDYRRGKLSSHKKFGEDMAILAGDALLTMAFELLSRAIKGLKNRLDAFAAAEIIGQTALAAGKSGMVGGQVADIKFSFKKNYEKKSAAHSPSGNPAKVILESYRRVLDYIHLNKTARLIELSCILGGLMGAVNQAKKTALSLYGRKIGLAFQITDDLLDDTPDSSDAKNFRLTYPALYGRENALKRAHSLAAGAVKALSVFPKNSSPRKFLDMLAYFIVRRKK